MIYPCQKCGRCCWTIGKLVEEARKPIKNANNYQAALATMLRLFPYAWDDSGRCVKLGKNNKCTIYYKRPLVCNVKKLYVKLFSKAVTWSKFIKMNLENCKKLRD